MRHRLGRLRVVANIEGARVIVDDVQVGVVPFEGQVSAGPHRVRVESDGMKAFEQQVTIRNGQLTPMRVRLRPGVDRGSAWVTTVFTALFIGGGVTLARLAAALERHAGASATFAPLRRHVLKVYDGYKP